jgi:hypothetical protein
MNRQETDNQHRSLQAPHQPSSEDLFGTPGGQPGLGHDLLLRDGRLSAFSRRHRKTEIRNPRPSKLEAVEVNPGQRRSDELFKTREIFDLASRRGDGSPSWCGAGGRSQLDGEHNDSRERWDAKAGRGHPSSATGGEVDFARAAGGVAIPGAYTLGQRDFERLPIAKTNRDLQVKHLGVADGDTIVLFSKRDALSTDDEVFFEPCDSFEVGDDDSDQIRPVNVYCNQAGYLVNGGLVALQKGDGDYAPLAQIPTRRAPVMGTDAGIALTIMKENDSGKGYEFFEGATAYYSITRLKTPLIRLVANLSALDMDAEKDFETGLGFGLLLRTPGGLGDNNNVGFGVLIGGGYNFMLDAGRDSEGNKREPWYWFVGFRWNFDRMKS